MRTTRVTPAVESQFITARLDGYPELGSLIINNWYVAYIHGNGTFTRARSISHEVLWGVINQDTSIVEVQEP